MVDIKREDITLQDWTKGISADEFAGGSYYYSEGIQSGYSTKGFKLGYKVNDEVLNYRSEGYPTAISPCDSYELMFFTKDGALETSLSYNGDLSWRGDENGGGALYMRNSFGYGYLNGLVYGDKAIGIRRSSIDVYKYAELFDPTLELLTEPDFSDGGSGWTVGTGWTITDNGAEHTTGTTGTLVTTASVVSNEWTRLAVKIKGRTAGKLTVTFLPDAGSSQSQEIETNGRTTLVPLANGATSTSATITLTPSSDFDGTVVAVNMHTYDSSSIELIKATITAADNHPAVIWGGDLYIGSGSSVDVVNLSDRGVTTKNLVDANETIIDITQQAGNLIIWATDGWNSRQYFWNGVDAVATEIIEWKGLVFKAVTGTEIESYVLCLSQDPSSLSSEGFEYRLYITSGYQRSLIATKQYLPGDRMFIDSSTYSPLKRFEFNDTTTSKSMTIYLDSVYLPGCDGVYKYGNDIPGMQKVMTRPIKYSPGATKIMLCQNGARMFIANTVDGVNKFSEVQKSRFTSKGYIVSEGIYRDKLGTRKAIEKLKIGYKNVASTVGNIKIYAIVDDSYFWRFWATGVTTRPMIGAVYNVAHDTTAEVIDVDKTNGIITLRTLANYGSYNNANTTLTKVSGTGDDSISVGYDFDNMCLIKTIESENQGYGADLIFGKDFVNNHFPYWHKIQLVIELNSNNSNLSPEVYEVSIASDISDVIL